METVLQAKNMTKIYGLGSKQPFTALENIDLEIKAGEFIVVMGASGSGKSTLVNNISTIDMPTKGNLYILNQEVKQMSENQLGKFRYQYLGFVFQNYNLLNSLTVYENIMIPLKLIGEDKKVIDEKVHQITKELDIESLLNKYPHECSGGQQQRVAIARALIGNPKIIIADEPTGNLDSQNSHEILSIFKKMNENHITIVMVSHDPLIASYSSRLLYLKDGNSGGIDHSVARPLRQDLLRRSNGTDPASCHRNRPVLYNPHTVSPHGDHNGVNKQMIRCHTPDLLSLISENPD